MGYFRNLRADEIDCRVQSINEKGLVLLLYKDARVDQNLLDETFGIFGWQRSHQSIDGRLYCTVSVYDKEKKEWISKQDVGSESNTEKEKGEASDSFKRACFNLGIGRELYTGPLIWVSKGKYDVAEKNGRLVTYDKFKVAGINIQDGIITGLKIVNASRKNLEAFSYGSLKGAKAKEEESLNEAKEEPADRISEAHAESLRAMCIRHEMPESVVYEKYGKGSLEELTYGDWRKLADEGERLVKDWDENHRENKGAIS